MIERLVLVENFVGSATQPILGYVLNFTYIYKFGKIGARRTGIFILYFQNMILDF